MFAEKQLPPQVEQVLIDYRHLLQQQGIDFVDGLYLTGSLVLDDYCEGKSDIDFTGLLAREATPAMTGKLAEVHAAMQASPVPFDGCYVTREALHAVPDGKAHGMQITDGIFKADAPCFQMNPVTWRSLARQAITIFGPAPDSLQIADSTMALDRFLLGILADYWQRWVVDIHGALAAKKPGETANADALSWGVLGTSRIAYTLKTGEIIGKSGAGRWAMACYPPWVEVIRNALAARSGSLQRQELPDAYQALDYIRFLIGQLLPDRSKKGS